MHFIAGRTIHSSHHKHEATKSDFILRLSRLGSLAIRVSILVIIFILNIVALVFFLIGIETVALFEAREGLDLSFEA